VRLSQLGRSLWVWPFVEVPPLIRKKAC